MNRVWEPIARAPSGKSILGWSEDGGPTVIMKGTEHDYYSPPSEFMTFENDRDRDEQIEIEKDTAKTMYFNLLNDHEPMYPEPTLWMHFPNPESQEINQ